jgi:hypothetical protein
MPSFTTTPTTKRLRSERGLRFRGIKKSSYEEQFLHGSIIEDTTDNGEAAEGGHNLIAGTAWLLAREELDRQLDYLFIDEAGQVSLANTVATGVSAKNVILVGDQMQLSQPLKGSHPGRSGLSALEHLLDGAATVPPQRGIFLSKTRQMHPDLCRFISDAFYDARLTAEAGNEQQCLVLNPDADPALAPTGLRFISVEQGVLAEIRRGGRPGSPAISKLVGAAVDQPGGAAPPDRDRRHPRRQPLQHAGQPPPVTLARGRSHWHGRQVPGARSGRRADLDGDVFGRRPAEADRVPLLP